MMNKLKNILYSWNEADNLLKEKIEKSKTEVLNETVPQEQFVAENMIPFPYYRESGYTINGVTYTYNNEGIITVTTSAPATASAYFALVTKKNDVCKVGKKYIVSAISDKDVSNVILKLAYINITTGTERESQTIEVNKSISFEYQPNDNEGILVQIYVAKGQNPVEEKIQVMLEEGITAHDYQPPIYSRKSLEKRISVLEAAIIELGELVGGED